MKKNSKTLLHNLWIGILACAPFMPTAPVACGQEPAATAAGSRLSVIVGPAATLQAQILNAEEPGSRTFKLDAKVRLNPESAADIYLAEWKDEWGTPELYISQTSGTRAAIADQAPNPKLLLSRLSSSGSHSLIVSFRKVEPEARGPRLIKFAIVSSDSSFSPVEVWALI